MTAVYVKPEEPVDIPGTEELERQLGISRIRVEAGLVFMTNAHDPDPETATKAFRVQDLKPCLKMFMEMAYKLRNLNDTESQLYHNSDSLAKLLMNVMRIAMYQMEYVKIDDYTRRVQQSLSPKSFLELMQTGDRKTVDRIVADLAQGMYVSLPIGDIGDIMQSKEVGDDERLPFLDYVMFLTIKNQRRVGNVIRCHLEGFRTAREQAHKQQQQQQEIGK